MQRLVLREFSGASYVLTGKVESGGSAVLGLSDTGAGLLATDGRGTHASLCKWRHGSTDAIELQFDLRMDSLPVLGTRTVPLAGDLPKFNPDPVHGSLPPAARALLSIAVRPMP